MIWGEFEGHPLPAPPTRGNRILFLALLNIGLLGVLIYCGGRL